MCGIPVHITNNNNNKKKTAQENRTDTKGSGVHGQCVFQQASQERHSLLCHIVICEGEGDCGREDRGDAG